MNINFLHKEYIKSFIVNNSNWFYPFSKRGSNDISEGQMTTDLVKDGRTYTKHGKFCVQTICADLYKGPGKTTGKTLFCVLFGMGKQNPMDLQHDPERGEEAAAYNAKVNPFMTIEFDHQPTFSEINQYIEIYFSRNGQRYVNTAEEKNIKEEERWSRIH